MLTDPPIVYALLGMWSVCTPLYCVPQEKEMYPLNCSLERIACRTCSVLRETQVYLRFVRLVASPISLILKMEFSNIKEPDFRGQVFCRNDCVFGANASCYSIFGVIVKKTSSCCHAVGRGRQDISVRAKNAGKSFVSNRDVLK